MALFLITLGAAVLVAATVLPLVPVAHGLARVCDFPRVQIAVLAAVVAILALWLVEPGWWAILLALAMAAVIALQASFIIRFTPLWKVQSLRWEGSPDDPAVVKILACNVKQSNRHYHRLVDLIAKENPHIAVLAEVDPPWLQGLEEIRQDFPYRVEEPLDNSYGMVLFSKLPLHHPQVRYLTLDGVPSIHTHVELPDGRKFNLIALHPEPPVPYADTLGRDAEVIVAANIVRRDGLPSIVTGDLNDVAWSRTNRRFQKLSRMLDPRVGRGTYSTFDARYPLLRWPLDHLFHEANFRLVEMRVLPSIGSDHFPIAFVLALAETEKAGERPDHPDGDDIAEAREVVRDAKELERDPIGTDWEK